MKTKSLLIGVLAIMSTAYAEPVISDRSPSFFGGIETSSSAVSENNAKIYSVRKELSSAGYTDEMMNKLFGDSNHYFPINAERLESTILLADLLVEQGVYMEEDRKVLIFLAFEAHRKFNTTNFAELNFASAK